MKALLQGEQDPEVLAEMARGRMREKREQLAQAVQGTLGEHHRFWLSSQLRQLDFFDTQLAELDHQIAHRLGVPSGPDEPDPWGSQPANELEPEASASVSPTQSAPSSSVPSERPKRLSSAQVIDILDFCQVVWSIFYNPLAV